MNRKNSPLIMIRDLTRTFDGLTAVSGLSLEVYQGEIFGFLGHNGAGKTTTVRLVNGLLTPDRGSIEVFGRSPDRHGSDVRARTGVLTETPSLEERLTARENLSIFADLYQVDQQLMAERIENLLLQFSLEERADDLVGEFSKGMKQRLALARTLLHDPELIFLDEPTSGLDPVSAREVQDLIASLSGQGKTIFLCTHNLAEAQRLCHRVAVLREGKMIAQGTPDELSHRIRGRAQLDLEVEVDKLPEAGRLLEERGWTVEQRDQAGMLRVTGVHRELVPDLVQSLTEAGVPLYQIRMVNTTLEDAYFALHDGEDKS